MKMSALVIDDQVEHWENKKAGTKGDMRIITVADMSDGRRLKHMLQIMPQPSPNAKGELELPGPCKDKRVEIEITELRAFGSAMRANGFVITPQGK